MLIQKRLKKDIEELDQIDPKYLPLGYIKKEAAPIFDRIASFKHVVFLRPNDPWMMVDDQKVCLPFPPSGEGLSMAVCALPLIRSLGGRFIWNAQSESWDLARAGQPFDPENPAAPFEDGIMDAHPGFDTRIMTLSDLLIPLRMGILLMDDGSVYVGDRRQLSQLDPPELDARCRLILHPFQDEDLFSNDFYEDEWGYRRRCYNQDLAIRSLAFSKASYNMRITQFIMDGWLDYTLVYEGKIHSRADDWNNEPSKRALFFSSIKQLLTTQSAKAVVMGRPTSSGKAIINITFTGTKHVADWFNNFKVAVSNHLHKGFYELATQFDSLTDQIHLTLLARTLGMRDLTLAEVFEEAKKPDSRFKIWVTGHSQGGALTQVYIAEFLSKRGVLHENIFGYAFACPSVATPPYCTHPGNYPVYNINNADDFTVRVGSSVRLGMDLMYYPDERFREDNYAGYANPDTRAMFHDVFKLCYWITDSFKFGEFMIAIASFATQSPIANEFVEWIEGSPLLKPIFHTLSKNTDLPKTIQTRMYRMLEKPYLEVGGNPPSEERIMQITDYLRILFKKRGMECFAAYTYATHQIPKNYSTIVQMPYESFSRGIWNIGKSIRLLTPEGVDLMEEIPFPAIEP